VAEFQANLTLTKIVICKNGFLKKFQALRRGRPSKSRDRVFLISNLTFDV